MTTPPAAPPLTPSQPRPFDPSQPHLVRPKLRPVRGFPVEGKTPDGKSMQMLGLVDARQLSDRMVVTAPAVQLVLPLLDGSRTIDDVVAQVGKGLTADVLKGLVMQFEDATFLEGPTFDQFREKIRKDFDASPTLPPASTAQFADSLVIHAHGAEEATEELKASEGPRRMREVFDQWMAKALEKAEKPRFEKLPKAIVGPHLDYPRGWLNYGHIYGRLRSVERPARVVILGTNHFGFGTGVVGCNKGYETPLGTCPVDDVLVEKLRRTLGDRLFEHRTDHENEHSIELHIPWIQHVFGKDGGGSYVPVFAALVHDPAANNGESYDGAGLALDPFVKALKAALQDLHGPTLIVASADLAHAGPAFGDRQVLVGEDEAATTARNAIVQNDLAMLQSIVKNKPSELVASMAWQQNPNRWCSTGNLVATLMLTEPAEGSVELLNYAGAIDPQGTTMVTSAAMVIR